MVGPAVYRLAGGIGMPRVSVSLFSFFGTLLALSATALASTDRVSLVPPDADVRAVVGTVVIGIAGGIVLALLDGGTPQREL